jgi:hypothetical protein
MAMNKRRSIWLVLLLAIGLLLPATPVLADGGSPPGDDGIVVWNEDYTLEEGEQLDGNLVVFNGDVTLEVDSHTQGSVIIWNGNVEVEGSVDEDVVVSGGDIYLGDDAWVGGNVVCSWNCALEQEEGARVEGVFTEGDPLAGLRIEPENGMPIRTPSLPTFWISGPRQALRWLLRLIRSVATILVVAAVAGLVTLIWPDPTAQVGRAVVEAPWHSLGIGVLTAAATTMLVIVLAVTICLSPIAILAALAAGAAGLFGWIAIGAMVGERLLRALNVRGTAPLWAAGLGTLLITLIGVGLSEALCLAPLGWLVISLLGCLGLGAVVLTRFGTTAYTPSMGSGYRPSPPPPSPPPAEEPESLEPSEEGEREQAAEDLQDSEA